MAAETLHDAFEEELKDILSAEKQLLKALPKMAKAASNADLVAGFEEHLEQTKGHVERLEKIFEMLEKAPRAKKCKAMEGLIEEGSEIMEEDAAPDVMDALLIGAAQKVEHYEIATYGTLVAWARQLEMEDAANLLHQTLDEEKETDVKLTELAETGINASAEA
ncbi:MAG TPA: ferritin-like domain-containing protein [Caulifigura sp.]|nr:ferritin-like domain-containing protein [Caulifigura sp.]